MDPPSLHYSGQALNILTANGEEGVTERKGDGERCEDEKMSVEMGRWNIGIMPT